MQSQRGGSPRGLAGPTRSPSAAGEMDEGHEGRPGNRPAGADRLARHQGGARSERSHSGHEVYRQPALLQHGEAVPQSNATQSVCDSVAGNSQESFDEGTCDSGAMFVITGDKLGFVTAYPQENTIQFSSGTPGWRLFRHCRRPPDGSDGTVSG